MLQVYLRIVDHDTTEIAEGAQHLSGYVTEVSVLKYEDGEFSVRILTAPLTSYNRHLTLGSMGHLNKYIPL